MKGKHCSGLLRGGRLEELSAEQPRSLALLPGSYQPDETRASL